MTERSQPSSAPANNTDRELWRGPDEGNGSYYADSIHVTESGGIGINVGGHVIVKPLRAWHALAQAAPRRVDDHMTRARRLVEDHIEAYGMVPHPDKIKDAIAEQSQVSFDLGFRAASQSAPGYSSGLTYGDGYKRGLEDARGAAQAADETSSAETERTAFIKAYPNLDLAEVPEAWGRPSFKHSHVQALWDGWFARATLDDRTPPQAAREELARRARELADEPIINATEGRKLLREMAAALSRPQQD